MFKVYKWIRLLGFVAYLSFPGVMMAGLLGAPFEIHRLAGIIAVSFGTMHMLLIV